MLRNDEREDDKEEAKLVGTPAPDPSRKASTGLVIARPPRRSPPASASYAASSVMDDVMSSANRKDTTSVTVNMIINIENANVENANILISNANFGVGNSSPVIEIE
jgi:hypothetical protein